MIRFALACDSGHAFESWFRDGAAYDEQAARGLLSCPACGSAKVEKAVMAPQIARRDRPAGPAAPEAPQSVAVLGPEEQAVREKLMALRSEMLKGSEDVGGRFAEEARKMHFGESEHKSIHGRATAQEARALAEDGVTFHPLPVLPDSHN